MYYVYLALPMIGHDGRPVNREVTVRVLVAAVHCQFECCKYYERTAAITMVIYLLG